MFANTLKPLYYFRPVEGRFCDATFIHAPKSSDPKEMDDSEGDDDDDEDNYDFSKVHLLVMTTYGSIMPQVGGPRGLCPVVIFRLFGTLK